MATNLDEVKGRAKEAAGAVTGDEQLKREGKLDRAAGEVKEKANRGIDKAKEAAQGK
jgi:uncharacterized protein YjbJ (UPF0337 family)